MGWSGRSAIFGVPLPGTHLCHLLLALRLGGLRVSVVIRLYDDQVVTLGVDDKLARGVLKRERHLIEHGAQLLQRQNPAERRRRPFRAQVTPCEGVQRSNMAEPLPQGVGGDGYDTLRTLFRGKAGRVFQSLVGQRRQVEAGLVGVAEPGAAGHGKNLPERDRGQSSITYNERRVEKMADVGWPGWSEGEKVQRLGGDGRLVHAVPEGTADWCTPCQRGPLSCVRRAGGEKTERNMTPYMRRLHC